MGEVRLRSWGSFVLLSLLSAGCSAVTNADLDRLGGSDGDADTDTDADGDGCAAGTVQCADGCFDLAEDPSHCGDCGRSCRADESCRSGVCMCEGPECECRDGTVDCSPEHGLACRDLRNDPDNCGECGAACAAGDICAEGLCGTPVRDCDTCADAQDCCERDGLRACFDEDRSPCD